ncbi:MAG: IS21 family transposase [Desulfobacterales bacterium]
MKNIREIIRLYSECRIVSYRTIARATRVSRPVVSQYLTDFKASGLSNADIQDMSDDKLLEIFNHNRGKKNEQYDILARQFEYFAKELKRTGVTLHRLWEEYKADKIEIYGYSQFCYHFQVWRSASPISMHIEHKAGEKMFCDFTGKKLTVTDSTSGAQQEVEVFIGVLGASQLTYVEAVETQQKDDWLKVNANTFEYFGGVTEAIVPDNLKSAVTKADKYEPDINPAYNDFARHYGTTILPARAYKPKDKALVENSVKIVYAWIFAALRDRVFYSIHELNQAIREELEKYNNKPMQLLKISRRQLFNEIEKDTLKPLPAQPYELKNFSRLKVQPNYHVHLREDGNYYSVPYRYRSKTVELIYSSSTVEVYCNNIRIALHKRVKNGKNYCTEKEHMPEQHKWVSEWTPDRFIGWAQKIGPFAKDLVETILNRQGHPEQAYKVCSGILGLAKKYGEARLNKACRQAISFEHYSYKGIHNILQNGLEEIPDDEARQLALPEHDNVRGQTYYQGDHNEQSCNN